jgi:hypothetical protein
MDNKSFWEIVEQDRQIVKTWPKWMQNYVITAESVSTGMMLKEDLERIEE